MWINRNLLKFITYIVLVLGQLQTVAAVDTGTTTQELRGGDVIMGFSGIVEITRPGGETDNCTGSMIADNIVLTAAHCLNYTSTTTSSGTGNFVITYHDPEVGRRVVYDGSGTWVVHQDYDPAQKLDGPGSANADIGVVKISGRFTETDYHDFLRLYADNKSRLKTKLTFFGGGYYSYSGNIDDRLRTSYFNVENVSKNHIVIDNRKKTTVCKGDSGGPLTYTINHMAVSVPTVAGVASLIELGDGFEGGLCANNDWGIDDAFFSRTNWEKLSSVMETVNISCDLYTVSNVAYRRCFELPFIEDVEYEGIDHDDAVAIVVAAIL